MGWRLSIAANQRELEPGSRVSKKFG